MTKNTKYYINQDLEKGYMVKEKSSIRQLKGLSIYFQILNHFKLDVTGEVEFLQGFHSIIKKPKSLEWFQLIKHSSCSTGEWLNFYIENNNEESHKQLLKRLFDLDVTCFDIANYKVKMNKSIIIVYFENRDKLYFKITEKETVRYLGGFIDNKKYRGHLTVNNSRDFDIFLNNYKINHKCKNHEFKEILTLLRGE